MSDRNVRTRADRDPNLAEPSFLLAKEMTQLDPENDNLAEAAVAPNFLADEVLRYARSHPSDESVPQALHLVVRSTRTGARTRRRQNGPRSLSGHCMSDIRRESGQRRRSITTRDDLGDGNAG